MPLPEPAPIREYHDVDRTRFLDEIRPLGQPAVLRGYALHWPAVQAGLRSDEALVDYVRTFRVDQKVNVLVGAPEIGGRFFYTDDLRAFNFTRGRSPIDPFFDRLLRDRENAEPFAIAVQSEEIPDLLPGFERDNAIDLVAPDVVPRAWIGNRIRVAPHYDLMENVGVVVAGQRRFTVFPPEQLSNLYMGPFELTPAGTPISLVDLEKPDLGAFPRFAEAWAAAQRALLDPGDAIYIPFHWWHAVDSLAPFNFFVNYWWNDASEEAGSPYDALMYAFFALKPLPPEQRAVWRKVFDHFVFALDSDPAEHLPPPVRGVLGPPTTQLLGRMRATLRQIMTKL
jgi:hypothetical protein